MDISNKSKWQVRVAALLIFVLGVAAGALGLNGYHRWSRSRAEGNRQQRFEQMLDPLAAKCGPEDPGPPNTGRDARTVTEFAQGIRAALCHNPATSG